MKKPKYKIGDVVLYENIDRDGLMYMVKVISGYKHNKTWHYRIESPGQWYCPSIPESDIISLK